MHGPGADFVDLNAALNWLAGYTITPTGLVTFLLAPGSWVYTTTVEINHPNATRIIIQGSPLNGAVARDNLSVTGYFAPGDITNQHLYLIGGGGFGSGIYRTELVFTGGITGFRIYRGTPTFRYLMITGDGTVGPAVNNLPGGIGVDVRDDLTVDGCAVHKFGSVGYLVTSATLQSLTSLANVVSGCGVHGILADAGLISFSPVADTITVSNGQAGWTVYGSIVFPGVLDVRGNGATYGTNIGAINVEAGAQFMTPNTQTGGRNGSRVQLNRNHGCTVADSSTLQMSFQTVDTTQGGQGGYCLWMNNGVAWFESSAAYGQPGGLGVALLQNGAQASFLGATVGGGMTPAPNVYQTQSNSFIRM